jgi:cytochrome oxidase assembly protein ShyY1
VISVPDGSAGSTSPAGSTPSAGGRHAARRRAAGLVAVAVALAAVCTVLGLWQWHRHETRDAAIAVVKANYGADPVPLQDVLSSRSDPLGADEVWRQVRVTGRYDTDATVLLRNRPVAGQPSFHVLVPLVTRAPDGSEGVLVVDRGWIPDDLDPADVAPARGDVEVVVRLRQDEPPSDRDAPAGQVQAIAVDQVLAAGATGDAADLPAYAAYGAMVSEDPAGRGRLGALPRPSTDPGSHLSYAMQWWTFALGSLVGFSIMARRELADAAADAAADEDATGTGTNTGGTASPAATAATARRRRARSAEDEEDALIDAQLTRGR